MSEPVFTLRPEFDPRPIKILRFVLVSGAITLAGVALALPYFGVNDPLLRNILFGVASLELVLSAIVPKLQQRLLGSVRFDFYPDRVALHAGAGNAHIDVALADVKQVFEEPTPRQAEQGLTTVYLEMDTLPYPAMQGRPPYKTGFRGLILPNLRTEEDPVRKIENLRQNIS